MARRAPTFPRRREARPVTSEIFPVFETHARYVSKENYFDITGDPMRGPVIAPS